MRVGVSLTSDYGDLDPATATSWVLERAKTAAAAGLDHLSLGDHHSTGPRAYVQHVPMIGRIMADWPAERPIGLLFLLPLWNPVLAAEQVGTLAAMSEAPFIVQTGIGHGQAQFAAMGVEYRRRGVVTDAAITTMKRLFAGERVDAGEFGVTDAAINPRPPVDVEWWIGSGTGEVPLERAARQGDAWYVSPRLALPELEEAIGRYRERCTHHGSQPRVALRRDLFVGDDDGQAVSIGRSVLQQGYRGLGEDDLVFGGVDRVAERLKAFADVGVDDIVARTMAVDQSAAVRSLELLGEVREHLLGSTG